MHIEVKNTLSKDKEKLLEKEILGNIKDIMIKVQSENNNKLSKLVFRSYQSFSYISI